MRLAVKLVIGFIALIAFTLGISVAFLATVGDDFTRRLLHHQMAEIIDRDIHIEGSVSLDVSLEPTLIVTDVRVANAPWALDRSFAHLERAEVQIVLPPLFSGIVHLRRLVFEGLTVRLETAPDGRENWHLIAATAEDEEDAEGEPEVAKKGKEGVGFRPGSGHRCRRAPGGVKEAEQWTRVQSASMDELSIYPLSLWLVVICVRRVSCRAPAWQAVSDMKCS